VPLLRVAGERPCPTGFHVGFNLAAEHELRRVCDRLVAAGVEVVRPLSQMGCAFTFQCLAPGGVTVELGWWPPR
jgi:uncharacterized glyoxalase superfamily protein PhnB